jgi:hypothetical protein
MECPREATSGTSVGGGGGFPQISRSIDGMNHRYVVYKISNCAYRQIYRQLVQLIDREAICKLFNALCVAKINFKCTYVYHCAVI